MLYSTCLQALLATAVAELDQSLRTRIESHLQQLTAAVLAFLQDEITPQSAFDFEQTLETLSREINRQVAEFAYNQAEGDDPQSLPHHLDCEGTRYRRLNRKTCNAHVATRFGKITLWRFAYRDDSGEKGCLFPLERHLGLVEGATPALADCAARYMAEAGASQGRVLQRLREEHGVSWGVKKLRAFTQTQAQRREEFRHVTQVARVLQWLQQARQSRGKCKPVLAAGRDGITLGAQPWGFWEVASVATLTVYDRAGQRLGTVYLAHPPESGQGTLSGQLTRLIQDVLRQWSGPLPRLAYITDAGDNETQYYHRVLRRMVHPRTKRLLQWTRVVDFYHAAQRITTMAEALFGPGQAEGFAWARRMRKLLVQWSGVRRVLASAAALKSRRKLSKARQKEFQTAYNYLKRRTQWMDYHSYQRHHLPIGSGVTEAACKTVFTSRLKLSGMRWKKVGALAVLRLRVLLLSGVWSEARKALHESYAKALPRTCGSGDEKSPAIAA